MDLVIMPGLEGFAYQLAAVVFIENGEAQMAFKHGDQFKFQFRLGLQRAGPVFSEGRQSFDLAITGAVVGAGLGAGQSP